MNEEADGGAGDADAPDSSARRAFLRQAGRYAAATPPVMVTMMTVLSKPALAAGSGSRGANGSSKGKKRGWYKNGKRT